MMTVTVMTLMVMMAVMMVIVSVEALLLQQVRAHVYLADQPERQEQHDGEWDGWMDRWIDEWINGGRTPSGVQEKL